MQKGKAKQLHAQEEMLLSFPEERDFTCLTPVWLLSLKVNSEENLREHAGEKENFYLSAHALPAYQRRYPERADTRKGSSSCHTLGQKWVGDQPSEART